MILFNVRGIKLFANYSRWARYAGHCGRNKDEFIKDVLLWTPTHGHTIVGQLAKICQLPAGTVGHVENLPIGMDCESESRESVPSTCFDDDYTRLWDEKYIYF